MTAVYDKIGITYHATRRPDARIASLIHRQLPVTVSVLNVGAGTGSYEPCSPNVVAVEPSATMIAHRGQTSVPQVRAIAESLPFATNSFDVVLGLLTLHHWTDWSRGLGECLRVAREKVVLFTWDPDAPGFWLTQEYFPQILDQSRSVFPSIDALRRALGTVHVLPVPIPADCEDGFLGAYWKRPSAYLDATVRSGISAFALVGDIDEPLARLGQDLETGEWTRQHQGLQQLDTLDLGYRLVVAELS